MLDEEQLPTWFQHPAQLAERPCLVGDGAEDECRDDRVELLVLEGQILSRRANQLHRT